jgi:hypothetical protein
VLGDVAEAAHLILLRGEREQRVEHDEDEVEPSFDLDVREVTDLNVDAVATWLGAQLRHHLGRRIYPVDLETTLDEWQRHPPGPIANSRTRPSSASDASRSTAAAVDSSPKRSPVQSSYTSAQRSPKVPGP